jgi:hypothetical protein
MVENIIVYFALDGAQKIKGCAIVFKWFCLSVGADSITLSLPRQIDTKPFRFSLASGTEISNFKEMPERLVTVIASGVSRCRSDLTFHPLSVVCQKQMRYIMDMLRSHFFLHTHITGR